MLMLLAVGRWWRAGIIGSVSALSINRGGGDIRSLILVLKTRRITTLNNISTEFIDLICHFYLNLHQHNRVI